MLTTLASKLEELIDIQKQLLDFAELKQVILIERKVDELNGLVKEEAKLVKRLNRIESEREKLVAELGKEHPYLSFSQFVEGLSDEIMKKKLQTQIRTLQELLLKLQAKNKINERLLIDSMTFVQHMIDQVTKTKQQNFNYQSPMDPQKSQTSNRGFFDTKA